MVWGFEALTKNCNVPGSSLARELVACRSPSIPFIEKSFTQEICWKVDAMVDYVFCIQLNYIEECLLLFEPLYLHKISNIIILTRAKKNSLFLQLDPFT